MVRALPGGHLQLAICTERVARVADVIGSLDQDPEKFPLDTGVLATPVQRLTDGNAVGDGRLVVQIHQLPEEDVDEVPDLVHVGGHLARKAHFRCQELKALLAGDVRQTVGLKVRWEPLLRCRNLQSLADRLQSHVGIVCRGRRPVLLNGAVSARTVEAHEAALQCLPADAQGRRSHENVLRRQQVADAGQLVVPFPGVGDLDGNVIVEIHLPSRSAPRKEGASGGVKDARKENQLGQDGIKASGSGRAQAEVQRKPGLLAGEHRSREELPLGGELSPGRAGRDRSRAPPVSGGQELPDVLHHRVRSHVLVHRDRNHRAVVGLSVGQDTKRLPCAAAFRLVHLHHPASCGGHLFGHFLNDLRRHGVEVDAAMLLELLNENLRAAAANEKHQLRHHIAGVTALCRRLGALRPPTGIRGILALRLPHATVIIPHLVVVQVAFALDVLLGLLFTASALRRRRHGDPRVLFEEDPLDD
mmetsp:Transcript_1988/g.8768  ORF Transcript_1988/g.8768 Transcript_1988/m.8768 type:complete len:474 (-) Transcript_1988:6819-8240(-)